MSQFPDPNVNVNFDPNLQQYLHQPQPEYPQQPQHYPEISPLTSIFTDAGHDERSAHMRSLVDFGRAVEEMVRNQGETAAATSSVLTALVERLAAMPAVQSAPAPAPAHAPAPVAPGPPRPVGVPKFREPEMFKGHGNEVESFLLQIDNALELQRVTLVTDEDKVRYVSVYLGHGSPLSWYKAIRKTKAHLLQDYRGFINEFKAHFDEPDTYSKSLRKLQNLEQTGSAADYTARFVELACDLNWTDQTKIQHYFDGLKLSVQDLLTNRKGRYFTDDFNVFTKEIITMDNELHQLVLNRKSKSSSKKTSSSHSSASASTSTSSPAATAHAPTTSSNDVVPMEIDAVHRGPISPNEKERRRKNALCLYCGQGQHFVNECPNKSAKAKANDKAKGKKANPSSGKA